MPSTPVLQSPWTRLREAVAENTSVPEIEAAVFAAFAIEGLQTAEEQVAVLDFFTDLDFGDEAAGFGDDVKITPEAYEGARKRSPQNFWTTWWPSFEGYRRRLHAQTTPGHERGQEPA